MVFALETYWPSSDGFGAARIEEQMVVTKDGCELMTRFPAEQLMVAGAGYFTLGGVLPTTREMQSNLNADGYSPNGPIATGDESTFVKTSS
jgi:Xaa-Pro aminopeptidase